MFTLIKLAPSATAAQASMVATVTRRPLVCPAATADAAGGAVAGGGAGSRPWFIAAGVLVLGVTAAAAIAWHSASADIDEAPTATPARTAQRNVTAPPAPKARDEAPAHKSAPPARQVAAVCSNCGTVESVQQLTHKGEGSGLGAVAGGVVGAAIGNQMGKGQGNAAMTVLGAVGGGLAGNEIEKRAKAKTSYRVTVKMEDGKTQVVEQAEPATVGQRVRVEGQTLKALSTQG